jgi:hypothetical protein
VLAVLIVTFASFLVSVVLIATAASLVEQTSPYSAAKKTAFREAAFLGLPFALLGVTVGIITGLSREAAVGEVLPAVLALVAGVAVYVIAQGGRQALIAGVSVVSLCISLAAGIGYGSEARVQAEQRALSFANQRAIANRDMNIQRYKQQIGLKVD